MTEVMADSSIVKRHDLKSLFCGEYGDFLVRNNGDRVKVQDLEGKVIGIYFSASWHGPHCRLFTPKLIEAYEEISQNHSNFEVVFVSSDWWDDDEEDETEEVLCKELSGMPWVAVPYADSTRHHLFELFAITADVLPKLVILDKNGEVVNTEGALAVRKYGSEAYPFTQERIDLINKNLEDAKRNQTLRSVLASSSRDFLISNDGNKVPVSDLEGKIVGLYFSDFSSSSNRFNSKLVKMYKKLKDKGENFEVVLVPLDDDESSFQLRFATFPWLAIPFKDKSCGRLGRYFELEDIPMLVVIGFDGKTLVPNVVELVEKHGDEPYPFSLQKMEELAEKENARMESRNLESLLVSWDGDYVIGNGDVKIPVSNLVGKNILLYFSHSAEWWSPYEHIPKALYSPDEEFLPKVIEAYNKIKAKETNFEVIFVSHDRDQAAFDNYFSSMPWLAVPFGDSRETSLGKMLNICEGYDMPSLRAIGPTGRVITTNVKEMIKVHGAEAYPFDEERLKELEAAAEEVARRWPERLLHKHHVLVPTKLTKWQGKYYCDGCGEFGFAFYGWAFRCEACDFTMHPKCAPEEEDPKKEGYVHGDPEVYYRGDGWTFYFDDCYFKCPKKDVGVCDGEEEPCISSRMLRAIGPTGQAIPVDIARACYDAKQEKLEVGAEEEKQWPRLHKVYTCGEIGDGWSFYCKDCIFGSDYTCLIEDKVMPWLATSLCKMLNIGDIPALRAIGPTGRVITTDADGITRAHVAEAYPFEEERLEEVEAAADEVARRWPERLLREVHVLVPTKLSTGRGIYDWGRYYCPVCGEVGFGWAFRCEACNFTLHPKCTLEEEDRNKEGGGYAYVRGGLEVYYRGDGWTFYFDDCYFKCPLNPKEVGVYDWAEQHGMGLRAIGPTGRAIPVDIARACCGPRPKKREVGAEEEKQRPPLHKVYTCGEIGDGWSFYCEHCIFGSNNIPSYWKT